MLSCILSLCACPDVGRLARQTAAQLKGKGRASEKVDMEVDMQTRSAPSLGWKTPDAKGKKKKGRFEEEDGDEEAEMEDVASQNLSSVCLHTCGRYLGSNGILGSSHKVTKRAIGAIT